VTALPHPKNYFNSFAVNCMENLTVVTVKIAVAAKSVKLTVNYCKIIVRSFLTAITVKNNSMAVNFINNINPWIYPLNLS
jgi:hypothetical protein